MLGAARGWAQTSAAGGPVASLGTLPVLSGDND